MLFLPLFTLKGESSAGSNSESRIELALTYRFGLSIYEQLNPDNVDLMRSLAGNRYDFIDRDYNVCMGYTALFSATH